MKDERPLVRIGQIAEMYDLTVSALNYYISLDLIRHVDTTSSGHRLFDLKLTGEALRRIRSLKQAGKTLDEIKQILRRSKVRS